MNPLELKLNGISTLIQESSISNESTLPTIPSLKILRVKVEQI